MGLALSGGGHRAAAFGLGALLYLVDAEKHREVTSIASVSGGSITNGVVASKLDFTATDAARFADEVAAPFATRLARTGTLFAWPGTWLYILVALATLAAAIAAPALVGGHWVVRLLVLLAGLAVWQRAVFSLRGRVCALAFGRVLYDSASLRDVARPVDHVFCSADLRSGDHVYMSPRFVYGWAFGLGEAGDLPLHDAVQCSACFPGAFPPRSLPTARHGFRDPPEEAGWTRRPRRLVLTDGGVYDNMADQWASGFERRLAHIPGLAGRVTAPRELIVVNSSAPMRWSPFGARHVPLWSELAALLRVKDVLYENTMATRRFGLTEQFERAELAGRGLRGTYVSIDRTPFRVGRAFADRGDERGQRARRVLELLGSSEPAWNLIARENARVRTGLWGLNRTTTGRLLYHAYVLTMINAHVILDYPLLPIPTQKRFEALAGGDQPATRGG